MAADISATPTPPRSRQRYLEQCRCCGCFTIAHPAISFGSRQERCPVCGWITDFIQEHDPQVRRAGNQISLNEAREAYRMTGAVHRALLPFVHPPSAEELDPRAGRSS